MGIVKKHNGRYMSSAQVIIVGFLIMILTGTALLMLPISTRGEGHASLLEALFTATSAACVTGLAVQDTFTYWSSFGQIIILLLIQIGGMGVVTLTVAVALVSGKRISLKQRQTLQDAISAPQVGGVIRLVGFAIRITLIIELIGALLLMPVFVKQFGWGHGIWFSVFHSISAFCNAGFDLMGIQSKSSSLTGFRGDILLNIVIMLLIIVGGIGFLTWDDIRRNKFRFKRYRMQSKVILTVSLALIVFPAVYYYFVEFSRSQWAFLSEKERVIGALFQSVTTRTAGFNTLDFNHLSEGGKILTILLMLIGGSPGSTAGGMKTTTIAVVILSMIAVFKHEEDTKCFGRRFPDEIVRNASAIFVMYAIAFMTGGIIISLVEQIPVVTCLFESASAIGTVGLTLGITSGLGVVSKLILIVLMFIGRVGGLTIVFAAMNTKRHTYAKLPEEKITVG